MSLVGPGGLLAEITHCVAVEAAMSEHLGYEKGERPAVPAGNHRNGVATEVGSV